MKSILKPKALFPGATIGIISPASPQRDPKRLERGIAYLESKGFNVVLAPHALDSWGGYLAGTDNDRKSDFESMFSDKTIDAIFCARGGYGTTRILKELDYSIIQSNPKIFVGFSDTTALQCALFEKIGLITFSGAMPSVDFADAIDSLTEKSFWSMLMHDCNGTLLQDEAPHILVEGKSEGRLICGNLCLLATLCGSEYFPTIQNGILLAEDIGEEPYRIDRYLSQLHLSGHLERMNGLLFGDFTPPSSPAASVPQRPYNEVIQEYAKLASKPSMSNLIYGHIHRKLTLPFGISISMDTSTSTIRFTESQFS